MKERGGSRPELIEWGPTIGAAAYRDGCRTCLDFCRNGVYGLADDRVRVVERTACVPGCSHCATLCAAGALTFPPFEALRRARRGA